ncbi:MAG: Cof-type HAD-IIB family hydrolase [Bacilli bacterium]
MTYSMIVLDMDDTLLTDDHTISTRTQNALIALQRKGKKVVLASGRPTYAMRDVAKQLQLDVYGSYILSYNGGIITDCRTNENIYSCPISAETAHLMHDVSKEEGVHVHTYIGDDIIAAAANEYTDVEARITGMRVFYPNDYKGAIKTPVVKTLLVGEPTKLKVVESTLQKRFQGELNIMLSKPYFLEVTHKDVDKGQSLARLASLLNIPQSEIIACGDSYNDASMIQWAGLGVAMGNANDDIKSMSNHVTLSNNEDGVAHVVEQFMF